MSVRDDSVHVASSWVLRVGVVMSVSVMLLGLALAFAHGAPSVSQMEQVRFSSDFVAIGLGALHGDAISLIELGVTLLVLTPILRVASSVLLFALERDRLYAAVTLGVLAMTLVSLFALR